MFDPTKPVQYRNGDPAQIISTNGASDNYPLLALRTLPDGKQCATSHTLDGFYDDNCYEHPLDLINIPETVEMWGNVYHATYGKIIHLYSSREEADRKADKERITCIPIKYTIPG